jgi:hypothetical protein
MSARNGGLLLVIGRILHTGLRYDLAHGLAERSRAGAPSSTEKRKV